MIFTLKVECEGKRRRTSLKLHEGMNFLFGRLCGSSRLLFTHLSMKLFDFQYLDEDGECITMSSDQEVLEALRVFEKTKCLKLEVVNVRNCSPQHFDDHIIIEKTIFHDYMQVLKPLTAKRDIKSIDLNGIQCLPQISAECTMYRNLPDKGSQIYPKCVSVHIWTIKNTSNVAWPTGTILSIPSVFGSVSEKRQLPSLDAGDQIDIVMEIIAPDRPGQYSALGSIITNGPDMSSVVLCCNIPVFLAVVSKPRGAPCLECTDSSAIISPEDHYIESLVKPLYLHDSDKKKNSDVAKNDQAEDHDEEGVVFEDFPSLILDASTGRVSSCSVAGSIVFVDDFEHASNSQGRYDEEVHESGYGPENDDLIHQLGFEEDIDDSMPIHDANAEMADIQLARVLYNQSLLETRNNIWGSEIAIVRSMGFEIGEEELIQMLADNTPSQGHYDEDDMQQFIMLLLAHTCL